LSDHVGSRTHLQWVGAGEKNAMKYPDMIILIRITNLSMMQTVTYETAKEIFAKNIRYQKVFKHRQVMMFLV